MSLEPFMEYITGKVDLRCLAEDWLEQAHIFNFGAIKTPLSANEVHKAVD